ncbi:Nif3-like dinuclear metal center hexameric protein [soil metagenome]
MSRRKNSSSGSVKGAGAAPLRAGGGVVAGSGPGGTVADLSAALEEFAPLTLAEAWDNVGLLLGSRSALLQGKVLLTIDLTEAVAAEAVGLGCGAIVAYHPPIFAGEKRITDATPLGRALLMAAGAGIAVYSPHTALDAAAGGIADWLADCVLTSRVTKTAHSADRRALKPAAVGAATAGVKVVTFAPAAAVEKLRLALASAGAGRIGEYTVCSFAGEGVGTFLPGAAAAPVVGAPGELTRAPEVRLEMVCPRAALAIALQTLRQFHPYETPAIDVIELSAQPAREVGAGRRIVLDAPQPIETLAARLKANLGVSVVHVAAAGRKMVSVIGVCPGAGGDLAAAALADGCELFVTGEMRHHDVLAMAGAGLAIALCGHVNTERGFLPRLARELGGRMGGVEFVVAEGDVELLVGM